MGERSYEKGESVSRAGLTVHQLYTESEFEVPSVVLKLVSNRETPVFVRLVVPDLQTDRIGFHAEFEKDSWTVEDGQLVFESELEPSDEVTTLYAVESGDTESIAAAMEGLQIDTVEDQEPTDVAAEPTDEQLLGDDQIADTASSDDDPLEATEFEAITDEDDQLVETEEELDLDTSPDETLVDPDDIGSEEDETETALDSTAGSAEFEEQLDSLDPGGEPESAETSSETESSVADTTEKAFASEDATQSGGTAEPAALATSRLVEELTDRMAEGELSPQQRRQLEAAGLGAASDRGDVRDEQIQQLQARVSDVETFSDSIERLFEEFGPPDELFEEYDQQLAQLESRVEELEQLTGSMDGVEQRIQAVEDEVESVEGSVTDLGQSVQSVESTIEEVQSEATATSEELKTVRSNQEEIESEVTELQRWRKKITSALQAIMGE